MLIMVKMAYCERQSKLNTLQYYVYKWLRVKNALVYCTAVLIASVTFYQRAKTSQFCDTMLDYDESGLERKTL
jgi:hypothetical protein